MMDIIDRLKQPVRYGAETQLQAKIRHFNERIEAADEITRLRAELESATKDAERYRFMISEESGDVMYETLIGVYAEKEDVDAAIDAAMKG